MRRPHIWYFGVRPDGPYYWFRLAAPPLCGIGATFFEARAEAARFHHVDPDELVVLGHDSRLTR